MQTTKVFTDLIRAYKDPTIRIVILRGGTRSGKTWAVIQLLIYILFRSKKPRLISTVSETMPHLKRGCIRDFKNVMEADEVYSPNQWHDTDKIYRVGRNSYEFFSADQPGKVHGPARDILHINEAIYITWEVFRQLAVRTTEKIILDYNPLYESWIDSKLMPRKDVVVIDSTYLDNDMLTAAQIAEIESNREIDPDWWKVYGMGLTGSKQGLIIQNWDIVADLPPRSTWKKAYIGVDFGWSAPTAIMLVVLSEGGEVWIDELDYGPNRDNPEIAEKIHNSGFADLEVICDKAEPKSIKELKAFGINAVPSDNKDIDLGIRVVNRYKKHYTARSLNSIDENRKYRYGQDNEGNYTGDPVDKFNHAKDAERYVFLNRLSNITSGFDVTVGTAGRK